MLYKPKFCNECGEKVEENFKFFSSSHFCENCEINFKKQEWLPKIALAGVAGISSLFAFGSYLKTPEKPLTIVRNQNSTVLVNKISGNQNRVGNINVNSAITEKSVNLQTNSQINGNNSVQKALETERPQKTIDKSVYFCGAQTKKGTACTRRVKIRDSRCWQHTGEAAMPQKQKIGD